MTTYIPSAFRKHLHGQIWGLDPSYNPWMNVFTEPFPRSNSLDVDVVAGDLALPVLTPSDTVALFGGDMSATDWVGHPLGSTHTLAEHITTSTNDPARDLTLFTGAVSDTITCLNTRINVPFPNICSVQSRTAPVGGLATFPGGYAVIGYTEVVNGVIHDAKLLGGSGFMPNGAVVKFFEDPRPGSLFRNNAVAYQTDPDMRQGMEVVDWKLDINGIAVEAIPFDFTLTTYPNVFPNLPYTIASIHMTTDGMTTITTTAPHLLDIPFDSASRADHLKPKGLSLVLQNADDLVTDTIRNGVPPASSHAAAYLAGTGDIKLGPGSPLDNGPSTVMVDTDDFPAGGHAYFSYQSRIGGASPRLLNCLLLNPTEVSGNLVANALIAQGIPDLTGRDYNIYDFPTTTSIRIVTSDFVAPRAAGNYLAPGPDAGEFLRPNNLYDDVTFNVEDTPLTGIVPCGGISIGSRMFMFVTPTTLNSAATTYCPGLWLAYSDNEGIDWVHPAGTGIYNGGVSWINDANYLGIIGGSPALHPTDGYVYVLVNRQSDPPSMMRVPQGSMLTKSTYEYWDGKQYVVNDPSVLYTIGSHLWADVNTFPIFWYDAHTNLFFTIYQQVTLGQPGYFAGYVIRTAHRPEGPWTAARWVASPTITPTQEWLLGTYGGFRNPFSGRVGQSNTNTFHMTLGDAYVPVMWQLEIGPANVGDCPGRGYGRGRGASAERFSDGWGQIPMGVRD